MTEEQYTKQKEDIFHYWKTGFLNDDDAREFLKAIEEQYKKGSL